MQSFRNKNKSIYESSFLNEETFDTLNRIKVLFWEFDYISDTVFLKIDFFDKTNLTQKNFKTTKSDFLNLFEDLQKAEIEKLFSEYIINERDSHRQLSKIKISSGEIVNVLNVGYSFLDQGKRNIKGILLRIDSINESIDNIEAIKRILNHISIYTDEEFWISDINFNFLFLSKSYSNIFECTSEELINTPIEKIFTSESIYYLRHNIEEELKYKQSRRSSSDKNLVLILKGYKKNGRLIWTENSLNFIRDRDEKIIGILGITRDVTNRIKTDQVREALYKISEYSHLTDDLNDFFAEIHTIVKAIMPANNFCICLYDNLNNNSYYPYHSDIKQQKIIPQRFSKILLDYFVSSEKGLFLNSVSIEKLINEQKIGPLDFMPVNLIGIPLKVKNEIKGVVLVYTYDKSENFSEEDFENLKFVADQTSMVIERKINETEKLKIKSLLEAVSKAQSILLTKRDVYLGIQLAFEQIGNIINVSRISLYENINDIPSNTTYSKLIVNWTSRNEFHNGSIDRIDFIPNLKRWLNEFYLGNHIKDKVNSLPLIEYEIIKHTKAKSILCIPIFLTKKLWGFIKFDDCINERIWSEREISVLSVVAAGIGGIFQRKIAEETLKTSEEKYRNFINNSLEGISLVQFTEPIDVNLPVEEQIDKIYETGFIAEANDSLAHMYGLSSSLDIIGESLLEIHGGANIESNRNAFRKFITNGYKVMNVETFEKKIDGTEIILLNNSIGIISKNKLKAIWGSQIDITDRKKFESELKAAKEKAEEANRIKSNFLSNMSHELRTPLIGILGYAEILIEEFKDTPHEEMASIIFQSGNRLLETLNSILTISKIESENFAVNYSQFDLENLIREVVELFHSVAIKKNIKIITNCSQRNMIIYSDKKIIREILNNLINNAIKYTPSGSVIIKADTNFEQNKLFLSVADTGIGIPEEKMEIIFEEFRQASEGMSRSFEGVGLGLAICKKYVQILNGSISVKSKINQGSTFIVEIPLYKKD